MRDEIALKPFAIRSSEFDELEERIKRAFKELLYLPLMRELTIPKRQLANASDGLLKAIQSGRIIFSRGVFSGKFTAAISKELAQLGAKWNRKSGAFTIHMSKLPYDLQGAIGVSEARFQEKMSAIDKKLAQVLPAEIAGKIKAADLFDSSLRHTDRSVAESLKGISVPAQLTPERAQKIAEEWQENLDLWIKDFASEEIIKLRKSIQKSLFTGNRFESLVGTIQKSYGVTANKAKFLARQETNLLVSKFKEARYTDAGVLEYRWACVAGSPKHPVRPAHKALEGKTFRWDNPPVTTEPSEPTRRNNPGQDFNCRCNAIPIVRFKAKDFLG